MKKLLVFTMTLITLLFLIPLAHTVFAASTPVTTPKVTEKMTRLPFRGATQSIETYTIDFPRMSVNANGSGNADQLGQFTIRYSGEVNLLDLSWSESTQFIGVNGDSIQAQGVGQATENQTPLTFNLVEIYTITGGTGRFSGASGTLTLHRFFNISTGTTTSTFEGYIFVP